MAVQDRRRKGHPEQGASAVEFALVMPVLVLIISGIIGFGIVFAQQISLGNAARQAARAAAVDGPTCGTSGDPGTGLIGQAQTDATTISVNRPAVGVVIKRASATPSTWTTGTCTGSDPVTSKACKGGVAGDNVYVRMTYNSTLALPFFQPSFNLSAIGAFRCEFS